MSMTRYALLILPSSNRVYADSAVALTQAELALFGERALGGRLTDIAPARIGGVPYVTFTADRLDQADAAILANLSSIYALFGMADDGALRPVELRSLDSFDDDLITILKYQGKTNEQFTKLLTNVTLLASAFAADLTTRKLALIDPLCGRGTSLSQALMYGWDAAGIDLDRQDFEAYSAFIQTWLKRKRIKHHAEIVPERRERRVVAGGCGSTWRRTRRTTGRGRPSASTSSTPTPRRRSTSSVREPSTCSSPTCRTGSSTAAGGRPRRPARWPAARSTCSPPPFRPGLRCSAPGARSGSHGTHSWRGARRRRGSSPTPALRFKTLRDTWRSGTGWTRRSAGTSWSLAGRAADAPSEPATRRCDRVGGWRQHQRTAP
jgi:hypothetical protein